MPSLACWTDPRGEFLGAKGAEPVYRLLGKAGLGMNAPPPLNTLVGDTIGYHDRTGKHDTTDYDWARYLDFADRHFKGPGSSNSRRRRPTEVERVALNALDRSFGVGLAGRKSTRF